MTKTEGKAHMTTDKRQKTTTETRQWTEDTPQQIKDKRHKRQYKRYKRQKTRDTGDNRHKTRNKTRQDKTRIKTKRKFLIQSREDRRPWKQLTKDIWETDVRKGRKRIRKKQWTRIHIRTKPWKLTMNKTQKTKDMTMHGDRNVQYRHKTQDWQTNEIINPTLFFSYTHLCMCLSFYFEYQIKQKTEQCSVIPTFALKGRVLFFAYGIAPLRKESFISLKGPIGLSCWQISVHLCHQATTIGYFLKIHVMFWIGHSSDVRYQMTCVFVLH